MARQSRALAPEAAERTVIRAPNHLGDLVMALPALAAAPHADVQLARWLVPILEMAPGFAKVDGPESEGSAGPGEGVGPGGEARAGGEARPGGPVDAADGGPRRILPMDRGRAGFARARRALRAGRYERGILLTPSLSSALLFATAGVGRRRGLRTDGRGPLLHEAVDPRIAGELHRSALYHHLVTGRSLTEPPVPRLEVPDWARARWAELVGDPDDAPGAKRIGNTGEVPWVGVFPGSNASSRRWDPDRFAAVARALAADGLRVVVFGGPAEGAITAEVAGEWALDLAGRTDLPTLAAGLAACSLLVTNDSGPMHLAAAVGTPTVSPWGAGRPAETRPLGAGHVCLQKTELPCVPCVRNECPRRGRGYILEDAQRECIRLIEVGEVLETVRARLSAIGTRG